MWIMKKHEAHRSKKSRAREDSHTNTAESTLHERKKYAQRIHETPEEEVP